MRKFIVVTGGVLSGLGKGVAAASIGKLLASKNKVIPIKCDGYLNTDPGTMNPIEHGEVFVLDDGGEVDMDFGHYERFLGVTCKTDWNLTMGKIFNEIRIKERRGDYLGQTVEYVPHVVNHIKEKWQSIGRDEKADIVLIEIGGTVGQIENDLYFEAARQLKHSVGENNIMFVHLTYVPIPTGVKEQKSKPTQQSVALLRQRGIQPDLIIGRCETWLTDKIKKKIGLFCDVEPEQVITGKDVDNIYKVPLVFEKEGVIEAIEKKLGLEVPRNQEKIRTLLTNFENPTREIKLAICGKYTDLEDSYASINEALNHCASHFQVKINTKFVETSKVEDYEFLKDADAVIVPGGFGTRGIEGKIKAIKYCRENNIPYLGICYGLQLAVVEFARNVCGIKEATTAEENKRSKHKVIDILPEQKKIKTKGGTMRLGAYPAKLKKGTLAYKLYGKELVHERHRHRFEVNPDYHKSLQKKGMIFSGMSPDRRLVEFMELPEHPYFIGTQAHPELKSKLEKPAPLFYGLIKAALKKNGLNLKVKKKVIA